MSNVSTTSNEKMPKTPILIPSYLKFVFGGCAGMAAASVMQPFDLAKFRMQLSGTDGKATKYRNSFHCIRTVVTTEGFFGLYNGLSAALLRQCTYTTIRLGSFTYLMELTAKTYGPPNFFTKIALGCASGIVGAVVGNPAEVSLIRMCADGQHRAEHRRNYKNVLDALLRIMKEEGVLTLWRGCLPTVTRATVVNAAQLGTYSQAKELLLRSGYFQDNIRCHLTSSLISGFVTTVVSTPVDMAKTRIQNMRYIDGVPEYKGAFDVLKRVVRYEGIFGLWKGFTPYYMRFGPNTVLTFVFLEQLNSAYRRFATHSVSF